MKIILDTNRQTIVTKITKEFKTDGVRIRYANELSILSKRMIIDYKKQDSK